MLKRIVLFALPCIFLFQSLSAQTGAGEQVTRPEPSADAVAIGQELFTAHCAACHKVKEDSIGPALAGTQARWFEMEPFDGKTGEELFYQWVKHSQELIDAGMPYAVNLFEDYDKAVMTPFPQLTNEDIDNIYAYVQTGGAGTGTSAETTTGAADDERYAKGETLFKTNCASCHKPLEELIGPPLQAAKERWLKLDPHNGVSGEEWFYRWVKNSQGVINEGLPYAVNLFNDYDKQVMNPFPQLSREDIDDIVYYVDNYTPPVPEGVTVAGGDGAGTGVSDQYTGTILIVLVIVLVIIVLILGRVTHVMNRLIMEKEGKPLPPVTPIYKNKKLIVTAVLILVVLVGYTTVDNAINLGRQQGYQPDQPIAYSHKLHAGVYQIDCQYCHVGASKGRHAVIPSANICMNCHGAIKKGPSAEFKAAHDLAGPANDTTEIAKIYHAYETGEPIEWVKIHNLPDHVYFNHAQHVNVGGVECQTCHGPVQEMEVVYQNAPLSMGWCISCHREREVSFASNEYYQIYEKFHHQLKEGDISKVTVEKIGGTDCQKCHY